MNQNGTLAEREWVLNLASSSSAILKSLQLKEIVRQHHPKRGIKSGEISKGLIKYSKLAKMTGHRYLGLRRTVRYNLEIIKKGNFI
jgi:hypothetical protein